MPINEERQPAVRAAVGKSDGNSRQPRWLMPAAVVFCATGVLIGVLLSAGAFVSRRDSDTGAPVGVGRLATAAATPEGTPATDGPGTASPSRPTPGKPSQSPTGSPVSTPTSSASPSTTTPLLADEPAVPSDVWVLRSVASSLCLDLVPGQPAEGADVQQVECTGADSQQWRTADVESGDGAVTVTLVNVASNKCLDVDQFLWSTWVQQETCRENESSQRWRVEEVAPERVRLISVSHDKCLQVASPTTKPGARITVSKCDKGTDQHWVLR